MTAPEKAQGTMVGPAGQTAGAPRACPHVYFHHHALTPARIQADAEFCLSCGLEYATHVSLLLNRPPGPCPSLEGLSVIEIGPGLSFGCMLVCRALGADRVGVLDEYLAEWCPEYHPALYRRLLELGLSRFPGLDWSALRRVLSAQDHGAAGAVEAGKWMLGEGRRFSGGPFDAVVSNAVLEHVWDLDGMCRDLADLTVSGGVGVHQVDFRDHSHDDEPLEFLKTPEPEYRRVFEASKGGGGSRVRPTELRSALERVGFTVDRVDVNALADAGYVNAVRPLLQPRFAALPFDELRVVGARFFLRKDAVRGTQPRMVPRPSHLAAQPPEGGGALGSERPARASGPVGRALRVVVFGAGSAGRLALEALAVPGSGARVVGVCDNDAAKQGDVVAGFVVRRFDQFPRADYDRVVIASRPGEGRISRQLEEAGLVAGSDFVCLRGLDQASRIEEDVEFCFRCGLEYAALVAARLGRSTEPWPRLEGLSLLEVGPGVNVGAMLVCRALGAARVAILDKYPVAWSIDYHPGFYARLLSLGLERVPLGDWTAVDAVARQGRHSKDVLQSFHRSAEDDCGGMADPFDAIVSNAVLEHVGDVDAMARQFARMTVPGGVGIHQVDFRDHEHTDAPLEFLRAQAQDREPLGEDHLWRRGNRVRSHELSAAFAAAGFVVEDVAVTDLASESYVTALRPRLDRRFSSMTAGQLRVLGARFFLRLPEHA